MVDFQEPYRNPSARTALIQRFVAHFNAGEIDAAIDLLSEDVFYHNIPMEPMTGREAVRAFTHGFGIGTRFSVDWQIVAIAEQDDIVLTERIDAFFQADGRTMSIPLMGSFRIREGSIVEWRDYFDLQDFERQYAMLDAPAEADA